jgi:hypothetical protein
VVTRFILLLSADAYAMQLCKQGLKAFAGMTMESNKLSPGYGAILLKRINVIWAVQPHSQKYFRSRLTQITSQLPPSRPIEGRIAIVTDAGRDAVDAAARVDERC